MAQHRSVKSHKRFHLIIASLVVALGLSSALGAVRPAWAAPPEAADPASPSAPTPAPQDDEDYVRFTLETGYGQPTAIPAASPYHTIRYEITRRRPATTAVHRRQLPGLEEGLHALGLLTPEESTSFFALARSLGAASLPSVVASVPTPGVLTWRCDLLLDGKRATFLVSDPENAADRRYARLFDAVRRTVLTRAGELPFRNVFFPAKDRGWLNIECVPAAAVTLDGFDTRLETPMYSYDIAAGTHSLVLRSLDGRFERTFEVRVEPQGTTTLRIDLR